MVKLLAFFEDMSRGQRRRTGKSMDEEDLAQKRKKSPQEFGGLLRYLGGVEESVLKNNGNLEHAGAKRFIIIVIGSKRVA
jgi:hypothetical protein